jgi:hypothetical protein
MALVRNTGDWKFQKETFHLPAYGNNRCCHRCEASKVDVQLLYTATGPSAPWRQHPTPHEDVVQVLQRGLRPLAWIPGWRLEFIKTDIMHNVCLRSAQHLVGCVIVDLCKEGHWGTQSKRVRLRRAWNEFNAWRKGAKIKCGITRFTLGAIHWAGPQVYPAYKGKAHRTRVLLAWVATVARTCAMQAVGATKHYALMRATCCWTLAEFCFLLDVCPVQLRSKYTDKLATTGLQFLDTYMWLAKHCTQQRVCLYAVKPKLHQPGTYIATQTKTMTTYKHAH